MGGLSPCDHLGHSAVTYFCRLSGWNSTSTCPDSAQGIQSLGWLQQTAHSCIQSGSTKQGTGPEHTVQQTPLAKRANTKT
mmetsp:Transcript_42145/g.75493  ORF Transcript_42145/g.75493 Transcript_42145/m.75493 type:complete len:80 (+) Transcript_42145:136-375(+)